MLGLFRCNKCDVRDTGGCIRAYDLRSQMFLNAS